MLSNDKLIVNLPDIKGKSKILFPAAKQNPTGPHFDYNEICERLNNLLLKRDIPSKAYLPRY
jgi:hypothetical protein